MTEIRSLFSGPKVFLQKILIYNISAPYIGFTQFGRQFLPGKLVLILLCRVIEQGFSDKILLKYCCQC